MLTQAYGWASEVNLENIFDKLFSEEFGLAYPESRVETRLFQGKRLEAISKNTHYPFL